MLGCKSSAQGVKSPAAPPGKRLSCTADAGCLQPTAWLLQHPAIPLEHQKPRADPLAQQVLQEERSPLALSSQAAAEPCGCLPGWPHSAESTAQRPSIRQPPSQHLSYVSHVRLYAQLPKWCCGHDLHGLWRGGDCAQSAGKGHAGFHHGVRTLAESNSSQVCQ